MILLLKIYWNKYLNDRILIHRDKHDSNKVICFLHPVTAPIQFEILSKNPSIKRKCDFNAYFVCLFVAILKNSENYRLAVTRYLFKTFQLSESSTLRIRIRMYHPKQHIIDYRWSDILNDLCYEKRELDSALAWLSTLGGAFSALGDNYEHCAIMAGRISVQQFRLALKLGDPQTVSRCKLFFALSLIQRGYLKMARKIITIEYQKAITIFSEDKRLRRMCCGIWAKLQYEWKKRYQRKQNL